MSRTNIIKKTMKDMGVTQKYLIAVIEKEAGIKISQSTLSNYLSSDKNWETADTSIRNIILRELELKYQGRVFLSYAKEGSEQAKKIYNELAKAGLNPWMDIMDIFPGEEYGKSITQALNKSDFVIICLAKDSIKRGFSQSEIRQVMDIWQESLAADDIYLIPVRLEDCDIPERLAEFNCIDLYKDDGWDKLIEVLKEGQKRRGREMPSEVKKGKGAQEESGKYGGQEIKSLRGVLAQLKECEDKFLEAEKLALKIFDKDNPQYKPLPYFTPDPISHCMTVEKYLNMIIWGGNIQKDWGVRFEPTPEEAMYLLAGVWLHEIGLMYGIFEGENNDDLEGEIDLCKKLFESYELRSTKYLLDIWHREKECNWEYEEILHLRNLCYSKRGKAIEELQPGEFFGVDGRPIRIRVIAAVIRLAEACDVNRRCVPGDLIKLFQSLRMDLRDALYWNKRHRILSDVKFDHNKGNIWITYFCPDEYVMTWGKLDLREIVSFIEKDIEEELELIQPELQPFVNTCFYKVLAEAKVMPALADEIEGRYLAMWPYFLHKPNSATEVQEALTETTLLTLKNINAERDWEKVIDVIDGMFEQAIRWHPYDFTLRNFYRQIKTIGAKGEKEGLEKELKSYVDLIGSTYKQMTGYARDKIGNNDALFVHGYSVNVLKFLEEIRPEHKGRVYLVRCNPFETDLYIGPDENERMAERLSELGYDFVMIGPEDLPHILNMLKRSRIPRKVILGTHGVLKNEDLLCKIGSHAMVYTCRGYRAKIIAFAASCKFLKSGEIDDEEVRRAILITERDIKNNKKLQLDILPRGYVDYLVTDEGINLLAEKKRAKKVTKKR